MWASLAERQRAASSHDEIADPTHGLAPARQFHQRSMQHAEGQQQRERRAWQSVRYTAAFAATRAHGPRRVVFRASGLGSTHVQASPATSACGGANGCGVARSVGTGGLSGAPLGRHRGARQQSVRTPGRQFGRHLQVCRLRCRAVSLGGPVRVGNRQAKLLRSSESWRCAGSRRLQDGGAAPRGAMRQLRRLGSRLRGWSRADRSALLHQRRCARPRRVSLPNSV